MFKIQYKIVLLFLLSSSISSFAQPALIWEKSIGDTSSNYANAVISTLNDGFVIGGSTYRSNYDDALVIAIDSNGSNSWDYTYSWAHWVPDILQTSTGHFIVPMNHNAPPNWQRDLRVAKLNSNGTGVYNKYIPYLWSNEHIENVIEGTGGNYVYAGHDATSFPTPFGYNVYEIEDAFISMYNLNNDQLWYKNYGGSDEDYFSSIFLDANGGYTLIGSSASQDGHLSSDPANSYDYWICRIDPGLNMLWSKTYGGTSLDECKKAIRTSDNGFLLCGYSYSNDGDVGFHYDSLNKADIWLLKLDSIGNKEWEKTLGGSDDDFAYSVVEYKNGYAIAGYTSSNDYDVSGNNGSNDFWLCIVDSIGTIVSQSCFGGSNSDYAYDLTTDNKKIVLVGNTWSNNHDVSTNYGRSDIWVLAVAPCEQAYELNIKLIDPDSVRLKWNPTVRATYEIRLRILGSNFWSDTSLFISNGYFDVGSIISDTSYEWQLRIYCPIDTTKWSAIDTFKTFGCNPPDSLRSIVKTPNQSCLTWYPDFHLYYEIIIKDLSSTTWDTIGYQNSGKGIITLDTLNSSSSYHWQIRLFCKDDTTSWSKLDTFNTLDCLPPTSLFTSSLGFTSAELHWDKQADFSYWIRYKAIDDTSWTFVFYKKNTMNFQPLTGLSDGTEHLWQIAKICLADTGLWSHIDSFTTLCTQPGILKATNISNNSAELSWLPALQSEYLLAIKMVTDTVWQYIQIPDTNQGSIFLNNLTDSTQYDWKLQHLCTSSSSNWTSNYRFTTLSCPFPVGLRVDSITSQSVELSWNSLDSLTSTIRYRAISDSNWTILPATYDSLLFLSGLDPGTIYEWQLKYDCSGSSTIWSIPNTFLTICPDIDSIFVNSILSTSVYLNWIPYINYEYIIRVREQGSTNWDIYPIFQNSGSSFYLDSLDIGASYEWQIRLLCPDDSSNWSSLNKFGTLGCIPPNILFASNLEPSAVKLNWRPVQSLEYLLAYRDSVNTQWNYILIPDSNSGIYRTQSLMSSMRYYWKIRLICNIDSSNWSSTKTFLTPICGHPDPVSISNITENSTRLNWLFYPGYTQRIRYRIPGNPIWRYLLLQNDTLGFVELQSLEQGSLYELQIKTICESDSGAWSPIHTFTTICSYPSTLHSDSVSSTTASLFWQPAYDYDYMVRSKITGTSAWRVTYFSAQSPGRGKLKNLTPNANYQWQIKRLCYSDSSNWSLIDSFTTLSDTLTFIADHSSNNGSLLVYPNPANNKLFIHLNRVLLSDLILYNSYGIEVSKGQCRKECFIDISQFTNGLYILKTEFEERRVVIMH